MLFFYSFIPSSIPWENVFLTFVGDTHTGCSATSMSPGLYALAEAWPVLALGLVLWPALTKSMSAPCLVSLSNQHITRFAISSSIFLSLFHCTGCVLCKKDHLPLSYVIRSSPSKTWFRYHLLYDIFQVVSLWLLYVAIAHSTCIFPIVLDVIVVCVFRFSICLSICFSNWPQRLNDLVPTYLSGLTFALILWLL